MGSILHDNTKTTHEFEKIRESNESLAKLTARYNINEKTVLKWKKSTDTLDEKSRPKVRPCVLTKAEQQAICAVRKHTRLPLGNTEQPNRACVRGKNIPERERLSGTTVTLRH